MTELGLLASQVGTSERTLRRAVNQGTLRGQRRSPRRLDLTAEEKQYIRRSWAVLAKVRASLRTEHNVRFALLFGSAARGEDLAHSDVDLLVEMRDASLDRIVDLEAKLEALLGRRIDVVLFGDAEANPALVADAVAEGRVLVDREKRWPALRAREDEIRRRGRRQDERRARKALAGIDRMLAP